MRSSVKSILGLITLSLCIEKQYKKTSLVTTSRNKVTPKKVKNKKSIKQTKYSTTKPIKAKAKTQFRNKSNI